MWASTMMRGPVVPCVAMIEPRPSKVIADAKGRISSTITLRIGSSNPGAPAVSASSRSSSTVRSCAPRAAPAARSARARVKTRAVIEISRDQA